MGNDSKAKSWLIGLDAQSTIRFPSTLGLTGQVFKEKSIISWNNAKNDSRFNPDIDNISSESDVRNFMIGVILGDGDNRAGVIQFINKKNGEEVTKYDIERFKAMRTFIGSCVENVTDLAVTINKTITIQGVIHNLNNSLEQCEKWLWFEGIEKQFNSMVRAYQRDFVPLAQTYLGITPEMINGKFNIDDTIEENQEEDDILK